MRLRSLLALGLFVSGAGDLAGGLWAVLDWKAVSAMMAQAVPDWDAVARASHLGLADGALRQLWANLGTALMALGAFQIVAGWWVAARRPGGLALARLVGVTLLVAAILMAGPGGQRSSLLTEGLRGAAILAVAWWTTGRDPDGS